ncbi:MAG: response regulator transcription factor [Ekhidna sp.]|nr:response regulator transcription factor [Ekhidna sp.]
MFSNKKELTIREREIIQAVSLGLNSTEISDKLFISEFTVKTHRKNIMQKMEVKNMAHLVRRSFELGLIQLSAAS